MSQQPFTIIPMHLIENPRRVSALKVKLVNEVRHRVVVPHKARTIVGVTE